MKKITLTGIVSFLIFAQAGLFAQAVDIAVKKFNPYAVIKMYYGYHNTSPYGGESETDLNYGLQVNSRIGAKVDVENMKTQFEFGLDSTNSKASLRLAFGSINFGDLQITAGQNYSPYYWWAVGDYVEDNNMNGFGTGYDGRKPQIKLEISGLYASFITVSRDTTGITGSGTSGAVKDTTVLMPKTCAGYDFKSGANVAGVAGAVNIIKINDTGSAVDGKNLVSWIGYAHTNIDLGNFKIRANFGYGQNAGNFGILAVTNTDKMTISFPSAVVVDGDKFKNTTTIEGFINPQYKISSDILFSCNIGYSRADNSDYDNADAQIAYTVDLKYSFNKYFSILPSFTYRDYMKDKDGAKQGTEYYAGAQLMVSI